MPLPDFQSLMLPLLSILSDGAERPPAAIREAAAAQFHLSEADLAILLPSGIQTMFTNRVAWALSYLKQAVLVESPRRGCQ
jgi:restriction system protein